MFKWNLKNHCYTFLKNLAETIEHTGILKTYLTIYLENILIILFLNLNNYSYFFKLFFFIKKYKRMFDLHNKKIQPLDNQVSNEITTDIKLPFSCNIIASKGSGKGNLILNLLLKNVYLKNKFNRCYYFSPTASLDSKTEYLKSNDFLKENTPLLNLIKKEMKRKNSYGHFLSGSGKECDIEFGYNNSMTNDDFKQEIDLDFLTEIMDEQKYIIEKYGKKYCDKILLIFDDFASSKILKSSYFRKLIFNSRHYNISTIITSQSYFQIEKSIRLNASLVLLYETGNLKEIKLMYEENNCSIPFEKWLSIYNEVISKPYQFLTINYQQPKKYRMMQNLDLFIKI